MHQKNKLSPLIGAFQRLLFLQILNSHVIFLIFIETMKHILVVPPAKPNIIQPCIILSPVHWWVVPLIWFPHGGLRCHNQGVEGVHVRGRSGFLSEPTCPQSETENLNCGNFASKWPRLKILGHQFKTPHRLRHVEYSDVSSHGVSMS